MEINGYRAVSILNGDYFVLENGDVYSFKRKTPKKLSFGSHYARNRKGDRTGVRYNTVCLSHNGHGKVFEVHRLVATCFLENPNGYRCVNHIDGNTLNNNARNLEWCSNGHNTRHAYKTGLIDHYRNNKHCKLCGEIISDINQSGYCRFCSLDFMTEKDKKKYNISKDIDIEKQKRFLKNIKALLDEKEITYKKLADMTGYAEKTIENYMKFQSTSRNVKSKILEVLEITENVGLPV